ncbi:enoyl-CoA hydratase/isomerase family protein [Salicibibacter cibarius]|uniref:Enoyl-CoA hydratase/isomerase family protein n=1 Tax=Salicibibacter cibarius TaxID=2743000 RepID=A0A7T7CB34_9BACI|nr:enoyl-CoA hydratase/isomerase family protein [Salicibibacter cibarius]QQK75379.1 enoyl-CoA hydratase/isomerase family protein [Salicibibacter cibarius]
MGEVSLEIDDNGIATVLLNYPAKRNILSNHMIEKLEHVISKLKNDPDVKVLVLRSSDQRFFSAGGDVKEWKDYSKQQAYREGNRGGKVFADLEDLPFVTIAAISGACLGGGCELALACDIRVATEDSTFGQPEITLGNGPSWGGYYRLARKVGISRAKEMILLGEMYNANQAYNFDLIQRIYPSWDTLLEEVREMSGRLAEDVYAASISKQILNQVEQGMIPNQLAIDGLSASSFAQTATSVERKAAFLNRKK